MAKLVRIAAVAMFVVLATLGCRKKEPQPARLSVEDNYSAIRLTPFSVSAGVAAEAYRWTIDSVAISATDANTQLAEHTAAIRDSTVSEKESLVLTFYVTGKYFMTCRARVEGGEIAKHFTVHVVTEFQSYKSWAMLMDYQPALGEEIAREYRGYSGTLADVIREANLNFSKNNKKPVYLGSFGGFATFKFDHAVQNLANKYDFEVLRNVDNRYYGLADVVVWVSDDNTHWYRLRSMYDSIPCSGSYAAGSNSPAVNGDKSGFSSDDKYVWNGDKGVVNIPVRREVEELVPSIIQDNWNTYRYEGFLLQRQTREKANYDPIDPTMLLSYEMTEFRKRAYNEPPEGETPNMFGMDIDWAVDADGRAVRLGSIRYVKVATGVLEAPKKWRLLESSVTKVQDLNLR